MASYVERLIGRQEDRQLDKLAVKTGGYFGISVNR